MNNNMRLIFLAQQLASLWFPLCTAGCCSANELLSSVADNLISVRAMNSLTSPRSTEKRRRLRGLACFAACISIISVLHSPPWRTCTNSRSSPKLTEWCCRCSLEDSEVVVVWTLWLQVLPRQGAVGEITLCSLSYTGWPRTSTAPPRDRRLLKRKNPTCFQVLLADHS